MAIASQPQRKWAVCYDIRQPRARRRVARLLEGEGTRVQRSVFHVVCSPDQAASLYRRCRALMHQDDRLLIESIGSPLPVPWKPVVRPTLPAYWLL